MFAGHLPDQLPGLVRHDLVPTIHDGGGLAAAGKLGCLIRVYLKVDCGLGRLGVPVAEIQGVAWAVAADDRLPLEGIYSYLPFEGEAGGDWAAQRYAPFRGMLSSLADDGIERT